MPPGNISLTPAELARYSRQLLLEEIGPTGQARLKAGRVLVVGAGGLGSPAALYLAAAGVGTIGLADFDTVAVHNLQRQLLHRDAEVGLAKSDSGSRHLRRINPHVEVHEHAAGITAENALEIFSSYDVILDGTDNFTARYLNNDAAFFARKPLVFGSVFKFSGQVSVFDSAAGGPCYRCLFPEGPPEGSVPGCGEAGVLGAVCGVIGSMQALEALKVVGRFGESLRGKILTYDGLTQRLATLVLPRNPQCPLCGDHPRIRFLDTPGKVAKISPPGPPPLDASVEVPWEISVEEARAWLSQKECAVTLLDVREHFEWEICRLPAARLVPLRSLPKELASLNKAQHYLLYCHHGGRSMQATKYLRDHGFPRATNLGGGIDRWAEQIDPSVARY